MALDEEKGKTKKVKGKEGGIKDRTNARRGKQGEWSSSRSR